jgi:hypothetical protein
MAKATELTARVPARAGHRAQVLDRPPPWILSATDLTFLWEQCPRCFYNKVALGHRRPTMPFPKVFGIIDRAMKDFYLGERAEVLAPGAPAGVIGSPNRWVKSASLALPGCRRPVVLRGRLDALVAVDDGTDSIIDFKTAVPSEAHVPLYDRQLHAYAWALEQPASGRPSEVSALGLLCFAPDAFESDGNRAALCGDLEWIGVPRDDERFEALLMAVLTVLDSPNPPPPNPACGWCLASSAAA